MNDDINLSKFAIKQILKKISKMMYRVVGMNSAIMCLEKLGYTPKQDEKALSNLINLIAEIKDNNLPINIIANSFSLKLTYSSETVRTSPKKMRKEILDEKGIHKGMPRPYICCPISLDTNIDLVYIYKINEAKHTLIYDYINKHTDIIIGTDLNPSYPVLCDDVFLGSCGVVIKDNKILFKHIERIRNRYLMCQHDICRMQGRILCGELVFCQHANNKLQSCKECDEMPNKIRSIICKNDWSESLVFCRHGINKLQTCKECDEMQILGCSNICKNEWCESTGIKKYNGYCLRCCIHLYPEIKVARNYKTKENSVVEAIKQTFPKFDWIADKRIQDGCSRRRPDLLLDLGTHLIIVEVDENKHTHYECSCENKRLMELSKDVGHRPIVFIRFNPDDYIDSTGKKIKSCWELNNIGVQSITKTKKTEWENRVNVLKQQIQYWIDNPNDKMIEIIELFY